MHNSQPLLLCLILSCGLTFGYAQGTVAVTKTDSAHLPRKITYAGTFKEAIRWSDSLGTHFIVTTETGIHQNPAFKHEDDGMDAEVFAYHYIAGKDSIALAWKLHDFIMDCQVDLGARFLPKTLQVTDLDKDGTPEVWLMYQIVCHGDISPWEMKFITYEGMQKHAMRGERQIRISAKEVYGGNYKFDKAFNDAPASFRDFALKNWKKHMPQKIGEE